MLKKVLIIAMAVLVFGGICATANTDGWKFPTTIFGDTVFVVGKNHFAVGTGTQLATFKEGLFEVRTEWLIPVSTSNNEHLVGVGVGINIVKLLQKYGATWVPDFIDSSVGVLGLIEIGSSNPRVRSGLYLSVIKLQF